MQAYSDVLPRVSTATDEAIAQSLILQVKDESWDGVFVDLKAGDSIVDRSVFRVVTATPEVLIATLQRNLFAGSEIHD